DLGRGYFVFVVTCVVALAIVVRIFMIQWGEASEWKQMAENFVTEYRSIEAVRGNILADDGSLLATSLPLYEIRMDLAADGLDDQTFRDGVDSLAHCLAQLFPDRGRSEREYKQSLLEAYRQGKRYHLIQKEVKYHQVQQAKEFPIFREGRYKGGVIFEKQNKRIYPFGQLARRTIGYERDGVTPVGLEGSYSPQLSGTDGKRLERRLIGGQWMPLHDGNDIEPEDGLDVVTAIDINIQDVAENALLQQLEKNGADHGCVILMEVETGFIKAIANLTYDEDYGYIEKFNYAVGESTEPGSTFKLPALLAAMEEGVVDIEDTVDTHNGKRKFFDRTMRDSNDEGYGRITVKRAFEVSSNVGISSVVFDGFRQDPQRFIDRIYSMGLAAPLGLEIKGEGKPMIKNTSDRSWSGVSLPWISIGYETLLTPLQILTFYNGVANDGVMVKPQFVTAHQRSGEQVWKAEPIVLNPGIASRENIERCKTMLEGVVEHGTASNLKNPDYRIAGKTGTAQIAKRDSQGYGHKGERSYQASFVGYFPAEDPKYSCMVVINAPGNHIYYGNLVAGPVFKEISDKVFAKRFDLQKQDPTSEEQMAYKVPISKHGSQSELQKVFNEFQVILQSTDVDAPYVHTSTKEERVDASPLTIHEGKVPNVKGMGLTDAVQLLENQGITVAASGRGYVKGQSLSPGTAVRRGMKIHLELAL
ncbi:MAG: PASTA domain-containing protein, partial [Flavobacteriales bacterium]|nr:PASTA domain-containing protein [Flavobacteriales bacterium]